MAGTVSIVRQALAQSVEDMLRGDLAPVDVCILDSGVDATHCDLKGRVRRAEAVAEQGPPVQGGEPDYAAIPLDASCNNDLLGHGTATASVVSRLAPNARITDIRIMDRETRLKGEALLAGFRRAMELNAGIINISLVVSRAFSHPLSRLCDQAYKNGQVVVAAKRNLPLTDQGFPGEFASCVGVDSASFRRPMQILYRPGEVIEYAARGENVEVASAGGGWTVQSGSSFAAPAVSALCSVLLGAWPGLAPFEVKTLLKRWSDETQ